MSIVRCEVCELMADLDYEDMVDMPDGKGFAHFDCLDEREVCPECSEHRPDDERVKMGMRCSQCNHITGHPISLAPATCADFEESNEREDEHIT